MKFTTHFSEKETAPSRKKWEAGSKGEQECGIYPDLSKEALTAEKSAGKSWYCAEGG